MGNKGQFQKGQTPHNKGKKLSEYINPESIEKIKTTQFKKASEGGTTGNEHPSWKGGIQTHKRDGKMMWVGPNKRKRIARHNYEEQHGKTPSVWIIYHLDQNKDNDDIENLIAVPRSILLSLNTGRMNSNYHEIQTAIQIYLDLTQKQQ